MPASRSRASLARTVSLAIALTVAATACGGSDQGATTTKASSAPASIDGAIVWMPDDRPVSMEVSPDWTETEVVGSDSRWSINHSAGSEATLTISIDDVDATSKSFLRDLITLAEFDSRVIDSGVRTAPDGTEIGYLETKGESPTDPGVETRTYVTFNIAYGNVAQATFTAPEANWTELIDEVRPYLETVRSI